MSLRGFRVDANGSDAQLLKQLEGLGRTMVASFRQMSANGNISFGFFKLQDGDINRVHGIVTEIDSRRVFYECGEDEIPQHAMQSLYEARAVIRETAKGIWANPACERIIQDITATLNTFCTEADRLQSGGAGFYSPNHHKFMTLMTEMRLKIWLRVALLVERLGSVIQPRNLPPEILAQVRGIEI